jgi:hypothetical protein
VQEHKERIIETETNMPHNNEAAMDFNRRYRIVIRDGIISEIKTSEVEASDDVVNTPVSVENLLYFSTDSPNEFDELIQLLSQAIKETRLVAV